MRTILQVVFSIVTAAFPAKLVAPPHHTPEPTIKQLVIRSARWHRVPVGLALDRAWKESRFQNLINPNRQHAYDVGVLQVNSKYHPEVISMELYDRIDLGVSILGDWNRQCRGDWNCAERAYVRGHIE